jgi:Ca2+-binding EF-hand superfamily protein
MFSLVPSAVDFPAFLTYITSLKSQISEPEDVSGAFMAFDEKDSGYIDYAELKHTLMNTGTQRMTEDLIEVSLGGFVERSGKNKGKVAYQKLLDNMLGGQRSK